MRIPAVAVAVLALVAGSAPSAAAPATRAVREVEPVVLTGADVPAWSRLPATGTPHPYPSGATDGVRDAHNGRLVVPPDVRTGVPVDEIAAYRWEGSRYVEVPVQVDERFPYFLANGRSAFSVYSGTDTELTYAWDVEAWKRTAGTCHAAYPAGQGATADPVAGLDDDDEIVFLARDAGMRAPDDAPQPTRATARHEVALTDPLDGGERYLYLFRQPGGSRFNAGNGYVDFTRDADADEWIDAESFVPGDPEQLGSSNQDYGPNLEGSVCETAARGDIAVRPSSDRFPRDGHTVRTDTYEFRASGRWMLRDLRVTKPGAAGDYGPDLIDRWKGRAFQQSPDSSISLVGFEDEQVNWEANSALLGWRAGPVRAIREVWGADSGTNVTKTETYYPDAVVHRYRVRVHPIPPDGLYTSWDYNASVAARYFNALHPEGVPIDGVDDDVGNVDEVAGRPAFFDAPDPTFGVPLAFGGWEQVSGSGDAGSLVYVFELTGATTLANAAVVPSYRDDACFDDGTGDDPVARPWPGEPSTDERVRAGYASAAGKPYEELTCAERQGAWGTHGLHFFATGDSDNAFVGTPVPVNEIDGQQWQFAVPTATPHAVGEEYANTVLAPLLVRVTPGQVTPGQVTPGQVTPG